MTGAHLQQALLATGEEWSDAWQRVLEYDPAYLEAYINLRRVPATEQKLPRHIQELVLLAMDAQCTHLHSPGIAAHTGAALRAGARVEEIIETFELCSALSVHALIVGVPLLTDALKERGMELPKDLTGEQQCMKDEFRRARGYWSEKWEPVLKMSPAFFEAYSRYSRLPFQPGRSALELKYKELIYCAIDCVTTHLFEPGLKVHIDKALEYGATADQIMEVFQLAVLMGAQTVHAGVEALAREVPK